MIPRRPAPGRRRTTFAPRVAAVTAAALAATLVPPLAASAAAPPPPPSDARLAKTPARHELTREQFYFVLPDRFANGDTGNDKGGLTGSRLATGYDPTDKGFYQGGDLKGLTKKLDYIKDLGTTAIWLAPIFKNRPVQGTGENASAGYHGYWITDFTQVDPHFGTNQDLTNLIAKAHAKGMKVFFDVITNHTADVVDYEEKSYGYLSKGAFPYLTKDGEPFDDADYADGTRRFPAVDADSFPYTPKVTSESKVPAWLNDPAMYHNRGDSTWAGESATYGDFNGLDDLWTERPEVVRGMEKIYQRWVRDFDIDGFRIDTVKHVNMEFWTQWATALDAYAARQGRDDFFMFGEVYSADTSVTAPYVTQGRLDSTLDFPFQDAARAYASQGGSAQKLARVFADDYKYTTDKANAYEQVTFLGNHDMGRIGSFLKQDDPDATDAELLRKAKLANELMFLSRGNPVVYYGDEQGFTGAGGDKDARQPMFATKTADYLDDDQLGTDRTHAEDAYDTRAPLYRQISALAELRKAHPALADGVQSERYAADGAGIYAFSRTDAQSGTEYVVAVNNADEAKTATFPTGSAGTRFDGIHGTGRHLHLGRRQEDHRHRPGGLGDRTGDRRLERRRGRRLHPAPGLRHRLHQGRRRPPDQHRRALAAADQDLPQRRAEGEVPAPEGVHRLVGGPPGPRAGPPGPARSGGRRPTGRRRGGARRDRRADRRGPGRPLPEGHRGRPRPGLPRGPPHPVRLGADGPQCPAGTGRRAQADAPRRHHRRVRSVTGPASWKNKPYRYVVKVWAPEAGRVVTNKVTDPYAVALTADSERSLVVDLADRSLAPSGWATLKKPKAVPLRSAQIQELHVRDFSVEDRTAKHRRTHPRLHRPGQRRQQAPAEARPGPAPRTCTCCPSSTSPPSRRSGPTRPPSTATWPRCPPLRAPAGVRGEDGGEGRLPGGTTVPLHGPRGLLRHRPGRHGPHGRVPRDGQGAQRGRPAGRHGRRLQPHGGRRPGENQRPVPDRARLLPAAARRRHGRDSTCCANTATENAMMGKLVVDSVVTWAKQYKIDGFRFDLMGHHPKANILAVRKALDALTVEKDGVDGKTTLYGEGWNRRGRRRRPLHPGHPEEHGRHRHRHLLRPGPRRRARRRPLRRRPRRAGLRLRALHRPQRLGGQRHRDRAEGPPAALPGPDQGRALRQPGRLHLHRHHRQGGQGLRGRLQRGTRRVRAGPRRRPRLRRRPRQRDPVRPLAFRLPKDTSAADRARMQVLAMATAALSQGPALSEVGTDLLRSKSLDRNSFDSGDWFNAIHWNCADGNGFGRGPPPAADNKDKWPTPSRC
ncbi:hypothetical protein SFUMM280S_02555 [Streptomyces fumanus]